MNSHQKQMAISTQVINQINYTKKKAQSYGTIAIEKLKVGGIITFKDKYLFTILHKPSKDLREEVEIQ